MRKINWLLVLLFYPEWIFGEEIPSSELKAEHRGDNCHCMEYWYCINRGGSPYSYCGLSESNVCCLFPDSGNTPTAEVGKPKCGLKGFDSGRDGFSEPAEWPWHVAIVEEPGFFYVCGGSLIDEYWVLTAAHCVDDYYSNYQNSNFNLKVRLGEYDVTSTRESLPHEDRLVERIILHPNFDNRTLTDDIGLLKLQYPAKQRQHIDVVCLAEEGFDFKGNSKCVITGWGRKTEDSEFSDILKEINIPLWNRTTCEESLKNEFGARYTLLNSTICAGSQGQDACDGDGGGPLVCEREGQWYQVGVISYGIGCGKKNTPGVYSKVSYYEKWIKETVLFSKIKL